MNGRDSKTYQSLQQRCPVPPTLQDTMPKDSRHEITQFIASRAPCHQPVGDNWRVADKFVCLCGRGTRHMISLIKGLTQDSDGDLE